MYQQQIGAAYPAASPRGRQRYTVQHEFDGTASVTATLAHALADVSGTDVTDVELTLEEYVDTDALDRLFAPPLGHTSEMTSSLTVNVQGYQTTLSSTGLITITPPQPRQVTHQQTPHQYPYRQTPNQQTRHQHPYRQGSYRQDPYR